MSIDDYKEIWKEIKPTIELIENYLNTFIFVSQDIGDEKEEYRLSNLKKQFMRGVMIAASSKYLPHKDKPTYEGYDFHKPAIVFCYEEYLTMIVNKNKDLGYTNLPSEIRIKEEAESWALIGIYPEITDAAIECYNKDKNIPNELSIFINDKNLDFSSPVNKAVKGFFKKLF